MTLMVAITQMPLVMVTLRSVQEEEKAFALGIQFVIFRLFGYIPSPIMFGAVIDSTCLLWKQTCEGAGGRCLLYDIELFRYKYVGICAGIKALAFLIFVLTWWLIKKREEKEKLEGGINMGEIVGSIASLDKGYGLDGPGAVEDVEEGDLGIQEDSSSSLSQVQSPTRQPMIPVHNKSD